MPGTPRSFITRWDLDKTYLRSRFDTLTDLVASALEQAKDKRTVPGATAVLSELGRAGAWVHILSGSPRQLQRKLEAKLRLDGVAFDELTLKPNLSNLLSLRLGALRDQLGYKLPELLEARARGERRRNSRETPPEILVGDDSESDAFVYSLYADLCTRKVSLLDLEHVFEAGGLRKTPAARCRRALETIPQSPAVDCILIHLDAQTPPSRFLRYGPRVIPFYNYLQAAFVLFERGFLEADAAARITLEFLGAHGFSPDAIGRSYLDLEKRGHARGIAPKSISKALARVKKVESSALHELSEVLASFRETGAAPRPSLAPPDYAELAALHRGGRNRRLPGQRFG